MKFLWRRTCLLFLVAIFTISACQSQSGEPTPPDILYGQDVCDQCGMIIGEPRFAAALVLADGRAIKFDDAGEMILYHSENPQTQIAAWFVHDYTTEEWIRGETAHYVKSTGLKTPMGTGIVAFKDLSNAEQLASEMGGEVYPFDDMMSLKNMEMP